MPENIWPQWSSKLAGAWKCTSFSLFATSDPSSAESENETRLLSKPHGDAPLGRVLISPAGFLSAHVARPDRMVPLPSGKPWQTGEDAEVAFVARGMSMYCGYLELFEDERGLYWETRVQVSSDPSRMGGLEVRRVEYFEKGEKKCMVLRPVRDMVMEDGTKTRAVLKWEKFE